MDTQRTHTVQIHADAYERLQRLIAGFDSDANVPRAFTEGEVVELALSVFETCNKFPLLMPLKLPFETGVAYFELERQKRTGN